MRLSLTVFAAAIVCASACDRGSRGGGSSSVGGAAGDAASGGAGASGTSIAGSSRNPGAGATDPIGATGGQAGGQACDTSAAACACDSQAPECQPVLMTACLGQHCPPSLDDARLVANWSLGSASGPATGRPNASYSECPNGSRSFSYRKDGTGYGFGFDASGRLLVWYTSDAGLCAHPVCSVPMPAPAISSCFSCAMFSDPQPEGTFLIPRGISNGPGYNCEIDADGRWAMPHLAPPG